MEEGDMYVERPLIKVDDCDLDDNDNGSFTSVLIFSIFTASCGAFVEGCTVAYTSPVQSAIIADLGLSIADYSLFGSTLSIGGLIGAFVCGKLTDKIGRRAAMRLADVLFITAWLTVAFSQGAWSLDVGRFLMGLGTSVIDYVIPVYIAEITPKNIRGGSSLVNQVMYSCGMAVVYIVGLMTSWRVLALIGIIPCLIQFSGTFFIPESPRWLVKVGRNKDCEAALQRLRGKDTDISLEAAAIEEYNDCTKFKSGGNFFDVINLKYAYALTVSLGLMALAAFGGTSGIVFYATEIFESAGFSSTIGTIAMALLQIPPTAAAVLLMDNFGRRPLLLYSAGGMVASCLSLAASFLLKEHGILVDISPYLALTGIVVFCAAFSAGMGGIPFVIMAEIFPVSIKGEAGSVALIVCYASTSIVSYTFNLMMDWSSSGTFLIFTSVNVMTLLFVAKVVPETKGRTLEDIQESLTPFSN